MWNFDIGAAPKSHEVLSSRQRGDQTVTVKAIKDIYIIAAYPGPGNRTGKTRWLPDMQRWEGMSKGQEPVAWMPWPDYPEIAA